MTCHVIFPSRMFEPRAVEDEFAAQLAAAGRAGMPTHILDQEKADALQASDAPPAHSGSRDAGDGSAR